MDAATCCTAHERKSMFCVGVMCLEEQVNKPMRIAIITENFLPKLDGVTRTLARLLEHLHTSGHQALLLGPDCGMDQYAGAEVIGTAGLPFPFYPELKFNFFRPLFLRRLYEFHPDVIHLVDPVILGASG